MFHLAVSVKLEVRGLWHFQSCISSNATKKQRLHNSDHQLKNVFRCCSAATVAPYRKKQRPCSCHSTRGNCTMSLATQWCLGSIAYGPNYPCTAAAFTNQADSWWSPQQYVYTSLVRRTLQRRMPKQSKRFLPPVASPPSSQPFSVDSSCCSP